MGLGKNDMFVLIRIVLGALFIVSGGEKLLSPAANFLFVIHGYDVLPLPLEAVAAFVFPWVEVLTGLFVFLGLWLRPSLGVLLLIAGSLMGIVGQAILRKLPLENCGCFGDMVHLPLRGVILLDLVIFVLAGLCLMNIRKASLFSLDQCYDLPGKK